MDNYQQRGEKRRSSSEFGDEDEFGSDENTNTTRSVNNHVLPFLCHACLINFLTRSHIFSYLIVFQKSVNIWEYGESVIYQIKCKFSWFQVFKCVLCEVRVSWGRPHGDHQNKRIDTTDRKYLKLVSIHKLLCDLTLKLNFSLLLTFNLIHSAGVKRQILFDSPKERSHTTPSVAAIKFSSSNSSHLFQ